MQKKCGFWVIGCRASVSQPVPCRPLSAGQKGKTLGEGVVTIDFGMNLLDVCCGNESLTVTLLLNSTLAVISLSQKRTLLPSSDHIDRAIAVASDYLK